MVDQQELLKNIRTLEEEANAQLTLYTNGNDNYAHTRYMYLMDSVRKLRQQYARTRRG
jgi:general stress protein 26